jgi:hypothetical protein
MAFLYACQKVKDLEGQIQSLSGSTTPHSDDSQVDKLPPVDPATITNLVSLCAIKVQLQSVLLSSMKYNSYVVDNHLNLGGAAMPTSVS